MTVRPMTEKDLEAVSLMEKEYFSDPWSKDAFLGSLENRDAYLLCAEEDGEVIGYACVYNAYGDGEICNVAVRKDFRRRGVGEQLLKALMEMGQKLGMENYTLEVRISNEGAIALYRKLGFSDAGIRPGFYEKPREDALIMWKRG